jgi:hypothetical protein
MAERLLHEMDGRTTIERVAGTLSRFGAHGCVDEEARTEPALRV